MRTSMQYSYYYYSPNAPSSSDFSQAMCLCLVGLVSPGIYSLNANPKLKLSPSSENAD